MSTGRRHLVEETALWIALVSVALVLAFVAVFRGYSELDVVATALLTSTSVYVVLRYALPLYLGLPPRPLASLDFGYIERAVYNSVIFSVLSLLLDSAIALFYPRTLLSLALSALASIAVLYAVKKLLGLKALRVLVTMSTIALVVLYALGYTGEPVALMNTT